MTPVLSVSRGPQSSSKTLLGIPGRPHRDPYRSSQSLSELQVCHPGSPTGTFLHHRCSASCTTADLGGCPPSPPSTVQPQGAHARSGAHRSSLHSRCAPGHSELTVTFLPRAPQQAVLQGSSPSQNLQNLPQPPLWGDIPTVLSSAPGHMIVAQQANHTIAWLQNSRWRSSGAWSWLWWSLLDVHRALQSTVGSTGAGNVSWLLCLCVSCQAANPGCHSLWQSSSPGGTGYFPMVTMAGLPRAGEHLPWPLFLLMFSYSK